MTEGPNFVSKVEVQQYLQPQLLRDIDAASMRNSVEVRTPLVDYFLYRELANLPAKSRLHGTSKPILRSATFDPLPMFPSSKQGFNVPIPGWMNKHPERFHGDVPTVLERNIASKIVEQSLNGQRPWTHGWTVHVLGEYLTEIGRK
jgi:asparagine synthase (glutamine-hydrolysing)